jgi:hypothetical protein
VGDLVFQIELALLEALKLELVLDRIYGKAGDDVVEVAVLEVQLVDAAPEHFTVGRMYYHGLGSSIPTMTRPSIDLKKTKNERCRRPEEPMRAAILRSCFF